VLRKFFLLALPVILFVLEVILSFPGVTKKLAQATEFVGFTEPWSPWEIQLTLGILLVVGFLANHVSTLLWPYKRFERFEAMKYKLLDRETEQFLENYSDERNTVLRVNVMLAERKFFSRVEPVSSSDGWGKPCLFKKHLEPFWMSPSMRNHRDADIKLSVDQGVAGRAFRRKEMYGADLTEDDPEDYNLNSDQLRKSEDLRFILSLPIRKLDPSTHRTTHEVLGVINVDSRTEGSERLINDEKELQLLVSKIENIGDLCSLIF